MLLRHAHATIDVGNYELGLSLGLVNPPAPPLPADLPQPQPAMPSPFATDFPYSSPVNNTASPADSFGFQPDPQATPPAGFGATGPATPYDMEGVVIGAGPLGHLGIVGTGTVRDWLVANKDKIGAWGMFLAQLLGVKLPPIPPFTKPM